MVQIVYKSMILVTISTVLIITSIPAISVEIDNDKVSAKVEENTRSNSGINGLEVARMKLKSAIDRYNNGDFDGAKYDLEVAIEWLNKASQTSKTEKSRESSRQLAVKIDAFKKQLKQSSAENENTLTRFWHQSTAIIGREIDQLIHGYVELATSEKTLKHLLDAKMHLYTAEHDLLVSHNVKDSAQELDSVLKYLDKADQVAKKPIQKEIIDLNTKISLLKEQVKQSHEAWKDNDEILYLNQAKKSLAKAKDKASPQTRLRIELIEADIQVLRADIERRNIKNNYESCMATLRGIINEL